MPYLWNFGLTCDLLFRRQSKAEPKSLPKNEITKPAEASCTNACTGGTETGHVAPGTDPTLVRVFEVWPTLPANIRAAILALVSTDV